MVGFVRWCWWFDFRSAVRDREFGEWIACSLMLFVSFFQTASFILVQVKKDRVHLKKRRIVTDSDSEDGNIPKTPVSSTPRIYGQGKRKTCSEVCSILLGNIPSFLKNLIRTRFVLLSTG